MNKVVLLIDTSSREAIRVAVDIDGERFEKVSGVQGTNAQKVLPMLESLLKEHNLAISDISRINVNQGPGSFTGLRVGMSIANTLSLLLGIPINTLKLGEIALPLYA